MMTEDRKAFDAAIRYVFGSKSVEGRLLFAFVGRTLKQLRLSLTYEPEDILTETYIRGVKQIEAGRPIHSPIGWLRRTAYYVMLEFRRKQDALPSPLLDKLPSEDSCNTVSELLLQEDIFVAMRVFEEFDSETQKLLYHRLILGQSWREVSKALAVAGEPELDEGVLRQRGFKAKKMLKELYEKRRLEVKVKWWDDSHPDCSWD